MEPLALVKKKTELQEVKKQGKSDPTGCPSIQNQGITTNTLINFLDSLDIRYDKIIGYSISWIKLVFFFLME